jgi:iron complex outermembrane receptor protein
MIHRTPTLQLLALAQTMAIAYPAMAQDRTSSTAPLETVVVTATRSPVAVSDAPASVTVLKREDIDNRNVSRITDALQAVPGLSTGRGENGQSNSFEGGFSLRGMDTRRTLVLLDGLQPLQSGSSQGVNWLTVFVDDVERVEVVSGPFASLYGSNAMGGVINVISKKPTTRELTLRVKKGFDDVAGEDFSVYVRQPLGTGFGVAAGLSRVRRDGYVSESTVRTPVTGAAGTAVNGAIATTTREGVPGFIVGDRGRQPWTQDNATVKLSYELSPTSRLHGGVAYATAQQGYERYNTYLTNAATGAPVASGTLGINGQRVTLTESNFVGSTPLEQGSTRWFAGLEATVLGDASLKADVSRIRRSFSFPTVGASSAWDGGPGSLTDTPDTSLDATVTLSMPLGQQHFLVAGVSLHRDEAERRAFALSNWRDKGSITATSNGYDGRTQTVSAFVQDEYSVTPALTLYLGGRIDRWSTDGLYFQNTAPVTRTTYPERSDTAFNPKVSGVFKAGSDLTLRASWGKSFRAPSNLDLYSTSVINSSVSPTGTLTTQSDPNLRPETASSWEVGGDWRFSSWAKASASVYQTRLSDLIYAQQIDLSLTQRINAGKARSQGVELGLAAKPLSWLEVATHVSWIDAKILDNPTDRLSEGKRMTNVPRRIAYLGLTARQGPWSATAEARYNGKTFVTARNTDVVEGVPGSNDPITTLNARIGYRFSPQWRLNLAVNNLLDRTQYSFARLPQRNATLEAVASF